MANFGSANQYNKIPGLGLVPEKSATAPAAPVSGQLWTDTSVTPNVVRWYNGTAWIEADGTSIPAGSITDAMVSPTAGIALSKLATNPLARANHTGTQLAATISDFTATVRANRLDQLAAPTANVDANGNRITNLASPSLATDAANKAYVDNSRAGLAGVKDPVRVVAGGNVNLAAPGATVDGVTLTSGDRFLAPAQNTGTENGLYVFNGASSAATRASDADGAGEVQDGTMVAASEGSKAGYQYIQTATSSGAPGTFTQTWIVFQTGGQTYLAGNGLTLTGTTFALDSPVSVANGGTGASTVAGARTALGALTRYAADLPALSAGVTATINHNLGTKDVHVRFRTTADDKVIELDWTAATSNTVTTAPDLAFAAGAVRVVIFG